MQRNVSLCVVYCISILDSVTNVRLKPELKASNLITQKNILRLK